MHYEPWITTNQIQDLDELKESMDQHAASRKKDSERTRKIRENAAKRRAEEWKKYTEKEKK